ncbi:MAG: hypothetical protein JW772_01625 [Candidatus Diapherotrites archaeon]|nr:hypothetical protein [Candidatus Diapherotrites archaeon]
MAMNGKGQASITDALYFLLIVSALSVFLFVYSMNYGSTVADQIERQFGQEYASSSFRTIFYNSTPRIPGESLEETLEVDYLLAAIKEDYADDKKINRTREVLANNIVGIMEPLHDSFDYAFYVYLEEAGAQKFAFLLVSLHNRVLPEGRRVGDYTTDAIVYLCEPAELTSLDRLEAMLSKLGTVSRSESRMRLPIIKESGQSTDLVTSYVNLAMWVSTQIPEEFNDLNCDPCWIKSQGADEWEKQNGPACPQLGP